MGLIANLLNLVFGGGRTDITDIAEVFRENAEGSAIRAADAHSAALMQFASEFQHERRGWFDRFVDGLNRLPRPLMALGTLGLLSTAMIEPVWFSSRMEGLQTVPEPLWWLLGAVVSFYFGARHQLKAQEFQKSMVKTVAAAPVTAEPVIELPETTHPTGNAALDDWHRWRQNSK